MFFMLFCVKLFCFFSCVRTKWWWWWCTYKL